MNIFYLDKDPEVAASKHLDPHVRKMILEYAQLLSTAHRMLDGKPSEYYKNGNVKAWKMDDEDMDVGLCKATHTNHPSAKWVRQSAANYAWLYELWESLCEEYTKRTGKLHATWVNRRDALKQLPNALEWTEWTEPTLAMPDEYKVAGDALRSYQAYYQYKTDDFKARGLI